MNLKQSFLNTLQDARELGGITDEMLVEKLIEKIPTKINHVCPMARENCNCEEVYVQT